MIVCPEQSELHHAPAMVCGLLQGQCLLLCNSAVALLNNPAALRQACKVSKVNHAPSGSTHTLHGVDRLWAPYPALPGAVLAIPARGPVRRQCGPSRGRRAAGLPVEVGPSAPCGVATPLCEPAPFLQLGAGPRPLCSGASALLAGTHLSTLRRGEQEGRGWGERKGMGWEVVSSGVVGCATSSVSTPSSECLHPLR